MEQILKQPSEKKTLSIDFSPSLTTSEAIQSGNITVTAKKISDGTDATSTIIVSGSTTLATNVILFRIQGGVDDEVYQITVSTGLTNQSNIHEEDIVLKVSEDLNILMTVDEVKRQLDVSDTSKDVLLFDLVKASTDFVENFIGRNLKYQVWTESFWPDCTTTTLLLNNYPAETLVYVVVDGLTLDLVGIEGKSNFILEKNTAELTRIDGFAFPRSPIETKITYKAGYKYVPEDIRSIVKKLAIGEYNRRKKDGITYEAIGSYRVAFDKSTLDFESDLYKTLKRFKNTVF